MPRKLLIALLVLALSCLSAVALAQKKGGKKPKTPPAQTAAPAEEPTKPAPPAPDPTEQKKADARTHFERGLSLFDEEAWDAALVEFARSREIFATRAATKNAAICLRRLHRFDEALDMFDALLREFPNLPPADKSLVEREVSELRSRVGTVDIRMTEPGASIVIDGRDRGTSPTTGPLRVSVGSHVVRVFKRGFSPFEQRIDVSGGQNVPIDVKLTALTQSGTLKVVEKGGRPAELLIDNVVVGKTPWEGPFPLGDHTVFLRGEGNLGTQPALISVKLGQETALTLALEPLDSQVRIEPKPAGATVSVDGVSVGSGVWDGRLRSGAHQIEVSAEGFVTKKRQLSLAAGQREVLSVGLERDPDSPLWKVDSPPAIALELGLGAVVGFGLGSDLEDGCSGDCVKSLTQGGLALGRVGYNLSNKLTVSLDVGYLAVRQKVSGRDAGLTPVGRPANEGQAFDTLWLRGLLAGASIGYRTGPRLPFTARLGVGALIGGVTDTRSGHFETNPDGTGKSARYSIDTVEESSPARYLYAAPEVRFGRRMGRSELSLGVQALMLWALTQPEWPEGTAILTGNCGASAAPGCVTDGEGTFGKQALTGKLLVLISPQVGFRHDF
ncbi:MAG: PEGA domain-containing protein [Polyangiaceae bacterium]|nr:PEGA domain-containing protein [Polyangiaceae bacterium]